MAATKQRQKNNGLTDLQRRFVEEYATDCNAAAAARRAGCDAKESDVAGSHLLAVPAVQKAVDERLKLKTIRTEISADWVVNNFKRIFERCMQVEEVLDAKGRPTGEFKFDARGANKALEMLGKSIGMFKNSDGRVRDSGDGENGENTGPVQHVKVIINMPEGKPMPSGLKVPSGVVVAAGSASVSGDRTTVESVAIDAVQSVPAIAQEKS